MRFAFASVLYATEFFNLYNIKKIAVFPNAVKFINENNNRKFEQPYGTEISIPVKPYSKIGDLVMKTNLAIEIEKDIFNLSDNSEKLNASKVYAYTSFPEFVGYGADKPTQEYSEKIDYISLTNWLASPDVSNKTFKSTVVSGDDENKNSRTLTIGNKAAENDSIFLKQIKKILLQKKINQIVVDNKRTFKDILLGKPAYNEVMFYEIKKYNDTGALLKSILIPNSENLDFQNYFDTQIKYSKKYTYEVKAWTLIIGNKYKYFDRTSYPKAVLTNVNTVAISVNETSQDFAAGNAYFSWLRVAHAFSTLFNLKTTLSTGEQVEIINMENLIKNLSNYFPQYTQVLNGNNIINLGVIKELTEYQIYDYEGIKIEKSNLNINPDAKLYIGTGPTLNGKNLGVYSSIIFDDNGKVITKKEILDNKIKNKYIHVHVHIYT